VAEDIVIVGAGIAGLTIGWELARRGHAPLVLGGKVPSTSAMAAGMLAPMPESSLNPALAQLAIDALHAYPEFLRRLAEDTSRDAGFVRCGVVRLAFSPDEADLLHSEIDRYEDAGLFARWLSARECSLEAPLVGPGVKGGLLSQDEAQVQSAWLLEALREALRWRGGRLEAGGVNAIEMRGDPGHIRLDSGKELQAKRIVVAAGSWTGGLLEMAGLVRPVRGQLLVFASAAGPRHILFHGRNYIVTKPDGHVLVGATMEEAGFVLDATPAAEAELRASLRRLAPALVKLPAERRVGLRPSCPDGMPVVGESESGVYVFSGHHRNGFLLGPLTAALAADEISGKQPDARLEALRPGRFGLTAL